MEKMRQTPHDLRMHRLEIVEGEGMKIVGPLARRREDIALPEEVSRRIRRAAEKSKRELP